MPRLFLLIVCFLSGFSALVCEVVWARMLVPAMGNTIHATGLVIGVFMGGLALGGFLAGRLTTGLSTRQRMLVYGGLEAGIGVFAMVFPLVNGTLSSLPLPPNGFIRPALYGLLLLFPTLLMGATFPFMGTIVIGDPRKTGRDAALIYGLNTLGGAAGVLAAGFFLIRELGSRTSLLLAGTIGLFSALVVVLVAAGGDSVASSTFAGSWLILLGIGVAGFGALAYELVWTRLLALVLQNSVYAFSLILAGNHPLCIEPHRLADALNRKDLRPFLAPVGLDDPHAILGCFVTDRVGLTPLLENELRVNTDDRPHNQFFPLSVSGFGRLKWHVENLRQLVRCRRETITCIHTTGGHHDPSS